VLPLRIEAESSSSSPTEVVLFRRLELAKLGTRFPLLAPTIEFGLSRSDESCDTSFSREAKAGGVGRLEVSFASPACSAPVPSSIVPAIAPGSGRSFEV
jgi:hypothetical protein